jgi:glycosyltransferase involved in cell wall biosynthesis
LNSDKGITVVISHFAPQQNELECRNLLLDCIKSIRSQQHDFTIEIIVCDDGSSWSTIIGKDEETIVDLKKSELEAFRIFSDVDADRYLYINSGSRYLRSRLLHHAYANAKYQKIVTLDDDHHFRKPNDLNKYYQYLDKYEFVRGRIIGPDGIPQLFETAAVQGTNEAFTKDIYSAIGGLGSYLFEGHSGADDDLTWQFYDYLVKKYPNEIKAAYAGEICTHDRPGSRWVNSSFSSSVNHLVDFNERKDKINTVFEKEFFKRYGVTPTSENPCRNKSLWMEFPSKASRNSEKYFKKVSFFKNIPVRIKKKSIRAKKFINYCKTPEGRTELFSRFSKK